MKNDTSITVKIINEILILLEPILEIRHSKKPLRSLEILMLRIGFPIKEIIKNLDELEEIIERQKEININFLEEDFQDSNDRNIKFSTDIIKTFERYNELFKACSKLEVKDNYRDEYGKDIGVIILSYLIEEYLSSRLPVSYYTLDFLGLIDNSKNSISLLENDFSEVIKNPRTFLNSNYFETNNFNMGRFIEKFEPILNYFNIDSYEIEASQNIEMLSPTSIIEDYEPGLRIPFFQLEKFDSFHEFGITLLTFIQKDLQGLGIVPFGLSGLNKQITLNEFWTLSFNTSIDVNLPFGFFIGEKDIGFLPMSDSQADVQYRLELDLRKFSSNKLPKTLLGEVDRTRLINQEFGFAIGLNKSSDLEFFTKLRLDNTKLIIVPKEGDNFINSVNKKNLEIPLDTTVVYSSIYGLSFEGSSGFEILIPVHKKKFGVEIFSLNIRLNILDEITELLFSLSFEVNLKPLVCKIDGLGLKTSLSFGEQRNLVFFNFDSPKIALPNSIAISLDPKSPITGAGYLKNDKENNRYVGALQLNLKAIELSATAIITTKLPNNKKGFSLLVSISTIFQKGIPLPFGFALKGVGGLLTLNRTMKVEVIRERMITGAINSIMFPVDVVDNIDKVVGDLEAVFPIQQGHTVIAPFMKIIWGTGKEIELDVGLFIEFPFKGRLVILGSLGIYMPHKPKIERDALGNPKKDEEGEIQWTKPIIEIHVEVLGDFNFGENYVRIEGILRDSQIKGAALTGGFVFVLAGGDDPQFLFSVGGFHPRYNKPPKYPEVPRVSAVISKGEDIVLSCAFYTAITSNSFQIGFRADLFVGIGDVEVTGYFSFDVLLQFDPFFFEVSIGMGVSVKAKGRELAGVELSFMLSGPKPWRVVGFAKIKIAFFKLKVKFDKSWGGKLEETPPTYIEPAVIMDALVTQFASQSNWTASLPQNHQSAEQFRDLENGGEHLVILHPKGILEVRQMVVPLRHSIDKWGGSYLEKKQKFDITAIQFGTYSTKDGEIKMNFPAADADKIDIGQQVGRKEYFAISQFEEMADEARLSTADFTSLRAGYLFQTLTTHHFSPKEKVNPNSTELYSTGSEYEVTTIDENLVSHKAETPPNTKSKSSRSRNLSPKKVIAPFGKRKSTRRKRFIAQDDFALGQMETLGKLKETTYCVVDRVHLESPNPEPPAFSTEFEAREYINELSGGWTIWQIMTEEACQIQKEG